MPYQFLSSRPENLLRSVNTINEKLRGTKRLDLFHCTRVDPNIPVEESIAALAKLKGQGKLGHIEMSECSAETLRRGTQGWYMAYIVCFDCRADNQTSF